MLVKFQSSEYCRHRKGQGLRPRKFARPSQRMTLGDAFGHGSELKAEIKNKLDHIQPKIDLISEESANEVIEVSSIQISIKSVSNVRIIARSSKCPINAL